MVWGTPGIRGLHRDVNEFKQFNTVHPVGFVEHSVTNRLLFVQRDYVFI